LGNALKDEVCKDILAVLDLMFNAGLSSALVTCLSSLVDSIPSLLKPVQERLLEIISIILARSPYMPVNFKLSLPPANVSIIIYSTYLLQLANHGDE
jgi:FKBP12-rapamycin complex-associated protein